MEKILIVDADSTTRTAIASVMIASGYVATEARDAASAITALEQQDIDLVVLDFMLGPASGIDVCRKVRELRDGENVPILIVSAASDSASHRAAIEAGADDFLTKPLHRGELLLRVRGLLLLRRTQRELAESNEMLKAQRDALIRAQRQKEELMEIIVHDLKNPLAAIVSNAGFLTIAKEMDDDVRDCTATIARASENMLRMVHNLLDVSRAEDASLTLQLERVDLRALLEKSCALMERRARERRVTLEGKLHGSGHEITADPDLLRRVLENLLDNAIRYTPAGSRIGVEIEGLDRDVVISVSDGGPGIPIEKRERVFEKYAQLERHADRAQERFGRGLGLAFVKLVAVAHGGNVKVVDGKTAGACFQVTLPRSLSRS